MPTKLDSTLTSRGLEQGPFDEHAQLSQTLKSCCRAHQKGAGWGRMSASHREATENILSRIAAAVNGDPDSEGHWLHIAGYAQRALEAMQKERAERISTLKVNA